MKKILFLSCIVIAIFFTIKLAKNTDIKHNKISNTDLTETHTKPADNTLSKTATSLITNASTTKKTTSATNTPEINSENDTATSTDTQNTKKERTIYIVKSGDVLGSIANKFDLKINTILQANNLLSTSLLHPGDELIILPFDAVEYTIKSGDTISKIAIKFDIEEEKILESNNLNSNSTLSIGKKILVPQDNINVSTANNSTNKTSNTTINNSSSITWTQDALSELYKAPTFVRSSVKKKVENYARSHSIQVITKTLYNSIQI